MKTYQVELPDGQREFVRSKMHIVVDGSIAFYDDLGNLVREYAQGEVVMFRERPL